MRPGRRPSIDYRKEAPHPMAVTTPPEIRLSALPLAGRAGLRGALASEFTKIRSVRSTYWTLGALFLVSVGLGIAAAAGTAAHFNAHPCRRPGSTRPRSRWGCSSRSAS